MSYSLSVKCNSRKFRLKRSIAKAGRSAARRNTALVIGIGVQSQELRLIAVAENNKVAINIKSAWLSYLGEDYVFETLCASVQRLKPVAVEFCAWGYRDKGMLERFRERGFPASRYEDGFIRTLQSHGIREQGYSVVRDSRDLYFHYAHPTDLEALIAGNDLATQPGNLARTQAAIDLFKQRRITKFGIEPSGDFDLPFADPFLLVIGQVEHDQSIHHGSPHVKTNARLAEIARAENPGATIVYKPHPQVLIRPELVASHVDPVRPHVDHVLDSRNVALTDLLALRPHLYTITSGAGFEALIYGCKVTTLGGPYYAGWGLTDDRLDFPRRTVRRTVQDIFWSAYMNYTRFCDLERGTVVPVIDV